MMRRSQQGVALIVILLVLAVMVSIAASMADRLFTQFKRAQNPQLSASILVQFEC